MIPILLSIAATLTAAEVPACAFWADAFRAGFKTPEQVDRMIADVQTARCNAIFIEVRLDGYSYYLRSLEPPHQDREYSKGFDALEYTIAKAHEAGIEVHAWFPVYPLWRSSRPPEDERHVWFKHGPGALGREMWMTVSSTGAVSTSLEPGHPDALRYLADVIVDPVRHYDLDGVHLDYVRYPETAAFGYNPVALERFERLGLTNFAEFRRRQVTDLVRQVTLRVHAIRPQVVVSAAVITWGNGPVNDNGYRALDAYSSVFQDWRGWLEAGLIDLAMPMSYFREPANGGFLTRWLDYYKDRQYNRRIFAGLGSYLNSIEDSMRQMDRVRERGMGVALYSYASTNILDALGRPVEPNERFYRAVGERISGSVGLAPTAKMHETMPWLTQWGGAMGWLTGFADVEGVIAVLEADDGADFASRRMSTDGTGFFGFVDLAAGRYRIRFLDRVSGEELYRTIAMDVRAGEVTEFTAVGGSSFPVSSKGAVGGS
jgi:uncharacterized lipoprotein YddW (UPF0748 family)